MSCAKNGWTDRDAVWDVDSCEPEEPCVRWGCTLVQPGEYDWTVRVHRRCGLMSNVFYHLFIIMPNKIACIHAYTDNVDKSVLTYNAHIVTLSGMKVSMGHCYWSILYSKSVSSTLVQLLFVLPSGYIHFVNKYTVSQKTSHFWLAITLTQGADFDIFWQTCYR